MDIDLVLNLFLAVLTLLSLGLLAAFCFTFREDLNQ